MKNIIIILLVFILRTSYSDQSCCVNITIAVLAERSAVVDFPFSINRTFGLINIAINHTQEMLKHVAYLNYVIFPCDVPTCVASKWGALFSEVYHTYKPHAIIGPGCTPSVQTVSRMAVSWNIPHLTYVGTDESLGNKKEYSMLSRLSFTMNVFAMFYVEVFNAFSWTQIVNLYDADVYLPNLVGTSLQRSFKDEAPHIISHAVPFRGLSEDLMTELTEVLKTASTRARVFIVSCHGDVFRQMVLLARRSGIIKGEYVFIFYFQLHGDPPVGEYTWRRGDDLDSEARLAYQSVMVIRPRRPTTEEFFAFEHEVKVKAFEGYNYTWNDGHEVSIYNIGHYDSFILYAHALNETLTSGEDPRDGKAVVKRMRNRTFPGIGGPVFVNENGDRDTDFTLLDLDPDTGNFKVVAQYLGWTRKFEFIQGVAIHWPGSGRPPSNVPACGFTGELCTSFHLEQSAVVGICLGAVILIVVAIGAFVYRRLKAEAEIHSEWWRIKSEDVVFQVQSSFLSRGTDFDNDDRSMSLATYAASVNTVGVYRGTKVHIRKPGVKSVSVDRKLLLELKQMHHITSQNLTRLIGLCTDTNNVCILTEHCSRGNLQDILLNESIDLDWDFRISLIHDIVEGMNFLHASSIGVHGHLSSTKCVIDSRFVLKITGFGLKALRNGHKKKLNSERSYVNSPELLWMAPEHLRVYPTRRESQPGDVYSFSMIVYEMCTRSEPYVNELWYSSLDDALRRIKSIGTNVTRPTLSETSSFPDIVNLAQCCWREIPSDRPNFASIRKVIRAVKLKRNVDPAENVLDVLLNRMEQYANNLEGLVEDRTKAFLEEKRKSEELLYQVLPRTVADQLRSGSSVIPESYDCVTIYFSDIVDFVSLSAKSSPFQIVDVLNDLYTCFDSIIERYNVYKVETIGDAYMVVSGLPKRNGNQHALQIARMALRILCGVRRFTIRHLPETRLQARIGLHSGPVCAGVVGRKMPRYCLFGDTVNTASRMESTGEAMKIQISNRTKELLDLFNTFIIEERGTIFIKGKGPIFTFWLADEISTYMDDVSM